MNRVGLGFRKAEAMPIAVRVRCSEALLVECRGCSAGRQEREDIFSFRLPQSSRSAKPPRYRHPSFPATLHVPLTSYLTDSPWKARLVTAAL